MQPVFRRWGGVRMPWCSVSLSHLEHMLGYQKLLCFSSTIPKAFFFLWTHMYKRENFILVAKNVRSADRMLSIEVYKWNRKEKKKKTWPRFVAWAYGLESLFYCRNSAQNCHCNSRIQIAEGAPLLQPTCESGLLFSISGTMTTFPVTSAHFRHW